MAVIFTSIYSSLSGRWCSCNRPKACKILNWLLKYSLNGEINLVNECVFLGTYRWQNNVLSSTFSSSYRMTIKSPQKFDEVLFRGYWVWVYSYWILKCKEGAGNVIVVLFWNVILKQSNEKHFMQYNLQNQFLMIMFVFILKLDACCCLNFLHRLNS